MCDRHTGLHRMASYKVGNFDQDSYQHPDCPGSGCDDSLGGNSRADQSETATEHFVSHAMFYLLAQRKHVTKA